MSVKTKLDGVKMTGCTLLILCAFTSICLISCKERKSDEEQILEVLNGYFEAHANGDYKASYSYLAPQIKSEITETEWIEKQSKTINSLRLMREPKLKNIMVQGDTAKADLHYIGIPSEKLTSALYQIYAYNFNRTIEDLNRFAEEELIEKFDSLSEPQTQSLFFVRTADGWSFLLDIRGMFNEKKNDNAD